MATIKDVAKMARVSIGTVSNVLNGKTQNEELIVRVEKAMEALSFRPAANARNLKTAKTQIIGIILPHLFQKEYCELLLELEHRFRTKGYSIFIKFSRNNKLIERKCIESLLEQSVSGIILYSTIKATGQPILGDDEVPTLLITRRENRTYEDDCIIIDYRGAFEDALASLKRNGSSHIGLIMENDLVQGTGLIDAYNSFGGYEPDEKKDFVKIVGSGQEYGFRAFFELYTSHREVDGIIASSPLIARGVIKAMEILAVQDVPIVAVKESSWIEDVGKLYGQMTISQTRLARMASEIMLSAIERPNTHEKVPSFVQADFDQIEPIEMGIRIARNDIKIAMYDCASSRSLKMLAQIYAKQSQKQVQFDLFPYKQLEELLYRQSAEKSSEYDLVMMDITWMEGLIESGGILNLDSLLETNREYLDGFIQGVLKEYGMYVESLYAIPFMSGVQILFYQKDLFEDQMLQRLFERRYKEKLAPPTTWAQFNLIAEFFTKQYNSYSLVEYGTSLSSGENVYTTISFLTHLWSYNTDVFDEKGNVIINNSNSVAALKNFLQGFKYCSGRELSSWSEQVDEFCTGASAMLIVYDSEAGDINNYTKSKVAGNIGVSPIPGGTPVLGGWSLGVNRYSENTEDAIQFLLWACGNQNGIPLSLLGGSTLRKEYYQRTDLEGIEPWKYLVLDSYKKVKKRIMPEILDESRWKNNIYTSLIPQEIMRVVRGEIDENTAIANMERSILQLIRG
ncbi:MAG: extracellular solute-binding protein [Lachnospiraceae bacterium]